jgi:RNA-dependent RNA polymerase
MGSRNDGTGILALPTEADGQRFLKYIKDTPIRVGGKKLRFFRNYDRENNSPRWLFETLKLTAYIDPSIEEEREEKIRQLDHSIRVDVVQFGVFYRDRYPRPGTNDKLAPRSFSIEWTTQNTSAKEITAWLRFEYDTKQIRIEVRIQRSHLGPSHY